MTGKFIHFDLTTLNTLKTSTLEAYQAALKAQEYEVSGGDRGRRKKSADLTALSNDLAEISYAIAMKTSGGGQRMTYADMSNQAG